MRRIRLLLIFSLVCGSSSCAPTRQIALDTDANFDGLAFWIISPFRGRPTYTLRWVGDVVHTYTPTDHGLVETRTLVYDCNGMDTALAKLESSILETAEIAVGNRPPLKSPEIVLDGPTYQLTYFPPMIGGSITLQSYESGDVPWIDAGRSVMKLAAKCGDS